MKRSALILLAVLAAGCVTIGARRERFIASHPELTIEEREAIREGRIVPGMTADAVLAAWGNPLDTVQEVIGGREVTTWLYEDTGGGTLLKTYRVRFVEDRVTEVKLMSARERAYSPYYRRYYWRHVPAYP